MIWQEEEKSRQRKREWWAFYAGCSVTLFVIFLVALGVVQATGGVFASCR